MTLEKLCLGWIGVYTFQCVLKSIWCINRYYGQVSYRVPVKLYLHNHTCVHAMLKRFALDVIEMKAALFNHSLCTFLNYSTDFWGLFIKEFASLRTTVWTGEKHFVIILYLNSSCIFNLAFFDCRASSVDKRRPIFSNTLYPLHYLALEMLSSTSNLLYGKSIPCHNELRINRFLFQSEPYTMTFIVWFSNCKKNGFMLNTSWISVVTTYVGL